MPSSSCRILGIRHLENPSISTTDIEGDTGSGPMWYPNEYGLPRLALAARIPGVVGVDGSLSKGSLENVLNP